MRKVPVREGAFHLRERIFHQNISFRGSFADDLLEIEITTDNGHEANCIHKRQVAFHCS